MLPAIRDEDHLYDVPKFELDRNDVENFEYELNGFHLQFQACFNRQESREHFYNYMAGQFSGLERKSIEPIALAIDGGKIRAMQRFVSETNWDDRKILSAYHELAHEDLASPSAALIFDESGFLKKGKESAGVSRQYCGSIGKVDNCQVGVYACYASEYGYALVDKRLFIPKCWFEDDHRQRRKKTGIPEDSVFKTKPELAAEMLRKMENDQKLPFKYILADSIYGMSPTFIQAAEAMADKTYMVSVPESLRVWLKRPEMLSSGGGRKTKSTRRAAPAESKSEPVTVKSLAKGIHNYFWYRRTVSEGAKGPITYEFTRRRVILSGDGLPRKSIWLLIRRTLDDNPEYSYFISNASSSARLKTLVWLSGLRWAIEQCFGEAKTELGMDHYEVRKLAGWNHHMLTCMLAHFFLWHLKVRLEKKSAIHYTVAA